MRKQLSMILRDARSTVSKIYNFSGLEPPAMHQSLVRCTLPEVEKWKVLTDYSIGGFSECTLEPSPRGMVWSGETSREVDVARQKLVPRSDQKKRASKVGFVALRLDVRQYQEDGFISTEGKWDLHEYHGLRIRGRFDSRKYILNVRADNVLEENRPDDLYQALIHPYLPHATPAGRGFDVEQDEELEEASDGMAEVSNEDSDQPPIVDVRVPWGAFTLTWRGYVQSLTPPAMNLGRITHLGFLLTDPTDETAGPFRVELSSISAFRYDDDEMKHDPQVREAMRLNREHGYEDVKSG